MSILPTNIKQIAVLVSSGKHPVNGQARHCHNDSLALTMGIDLSKKTAAQLQVLHAGEPNNPALQDYLALGASQIDVISAEASIQNWADNLKHANLILTGTQAEDGLDSGLLPYMLAEKLNMPIVANALEIKPMGDKLEILQFLPKGKRRKVVVTLPVVIAIHPLASAQLRYVYMQQQQGRIVVADSSIKQSNMAAKPNGQRPIERNMRKPNKLKAHEDLAGHVRLLAAISSDSTGGTVVNEGNNVEKAQVILAYLREHQLIDF